MVLTVAAGAESGSAGPPLHPSPVGALVAGVADAKLLVSRAGSDLADVILELDDVEQNWKKICRFFECLIHSNE